MRDAIGVLAIKGNSKLLHSNPHSDWYRHWIFHCYSFLKVLKQFRLILISKCENEYSVNSYGFSDSLHFVAAKPQLNLIQVNEINRRYLAWIYMIPRIGETQECRTHGVSHLLPKNLSVFTWNNLYLSGFSYKICCFSCGGVIFFFK